ncbi:unnamed protein product [Jaminaea pallidilutea]
MESVETPLFGQASSDITAEFYKPHQNAAFQLLQLRTPSPAFSVDSASDYFGQSSVSSSRERHSTSSRRQRESSFTSSVASMSSTADDAQMIELMADIGHMSRGSASRWRKVATTMPRSLWKPESEASTCDHLYLGSACEKSFGHFVAGYRLPANMAPSQHASRRSWTGVKSVRRNHCWRCGNCFCDDHGSAFATLVLDDEDVPHSTVASPQEPSVSEDTSSPKVPAPGPTTRSAIGELSRYLAAAEVDRDRTRQMSVSSSSPGSQGSSVSGSSNLAESLRRHQPSAVDSESDHRSAPQHSQDAGMDEGMPPILSLPELVKSSDLSCSSTTSLRQLLYDNASMTAASISSRMATLPDGRYVVREKVCTRCAGIVEESKERSLAKQAARDQQQRAAQLESDRRSSDPLSLVAPREEDQADFMMSIQRLYEDYRHEKRKHLAAMRSRSAETVPQTSHARSKLAPPPPRYIRRQSTPMLDSDSEDEESVGSVPRHHTLPRREGAIQGNKGAMAAERRHMHQNTALPQCGMGGQRLQHAFACCQ